MKKFLGILLCAALTLQSAGVLVRADAEGVETFRDDVPSWVGNHIAFDTAKIYLTHEAYSGDAAMLVDVPTYGSIASPTNTGIPLNDPAAYEYLRAGDQYKLVMYKMPLEQKEDGTYDMGHNSIRIYNEFTTIDNPVIIDPDTNESVSGNFERKWYRLEYDFQMNSNMLATSEKLSLLPNVDCIYDNITLYQQVGDEYREVPDQYGIRNGDFEIGVFEPDESNIDTTVSYDAGDIGESMYITNGSPSVHFIQQVYYADASDSQALKIMVKDGYEEIWCATADSLDKNINTMQIRYKVAENYSESGNESIYLTADGENASKKIVPNTYETSKDGWEEFTAVWDGPVTYPKVYVQDHITVYFDEISFGTTVDGVYNKVTVNGFANNWNTNKNTPNPVTGLTADVSEDDNSVTLSFNLPAENPVTPYGTKVYQMVDGEWKFVKSADSSSDSIKIENVDTAKNNVFAVSVLGINLYESEKVSVATAQDVYDIMAEGSADGAKISWKLNRDFKAIKLYNGSELIDIISPDRTSYYLELEEGSYVITLVPIREDGSEAGEYPIAVSTLPIYYNDTINNCGDDCYVFDHNALYEIIRPVYKNIQDGDGWVAKVSTMENTRAYFIQTFDRISGVSEGQHMKVSFDYMIQEPGNGDIEFYKASDTWEGSGECDLIDARNTTGWVSYESEFDYTDGLVSTFRPCGSVVMYINNFRITDAESGETVLYQAYNGYGCQGTWDGAEGVMHPTTPPGVLNLGGEGVSGGTAQLDWDIPADSPILIDGFRIYEIDPDSYEPIAEIKTVAGNNTGCFVNNLTAGEHLFAVVPVGVNEALSDIWEYVYVDVSAGYELSFDKDTAAEGTLSATATYNDISYLKTGSVLCLALYNNGRFVKMVTAEPQLDLADNLPLSFSVSVQIPAEEEEDNYSAKAFVWESLDNMVPVTGTISVE